MRIAGITKMGFYATPPISQQRIANYLVGERKGTIRLLDPCAGYGIALKAMADHLSNQGATTSTYGVELSDERGPSMRDTLDHGIQGDWANVSMTAQSMSLLWANPPYDHEMISSEDAEKGEKSQRLEYRFLQSSMQKLAIDGVLVYIVPLHILQTKRYTGYISTNFRDIRVYRFPDEEYEQYKQVVLFAYRKKYSAGGNNEQIPEYSSENLPPELPAEADAEYIVPAYKKAKVNFYIDILEDDEVLRRVKTHGAHTTRQWAQHTQAIDESEFQPIVKLNIGHIGHLITSGQIGVVELPDKLTIGRVSKGQDTIIKGTYIDAEGIEKQNIITRDHFVTTVTSLTRKGEIQTINNSDGLEKLITEYGEEIGTIVEKKYQPIYTGPTDKEWQALMPLMKKRILAGRADTGLFIAQKHVAAAMKRAIDKKKWVILVGEMGTGKTATSLATAALKDKWPALVLCPTHLVHKWAAEVPDVIPGARGFVIESLADLETFVEDWKPGRKWVAVLSKETAKLTPGWKHSFTTMVKKLDYTMPDGKTMKVRRRIITCPKCGQPVKDDKEQYIVVPATCERMTKEDFKLLPNGGKKRMMCRNPQPRWHGDSHDNSEKGTWQEKDSKEKDFICGQSLWRVDSTRVWQEYTLETCRKAEELRVHPSLVPGAEFDPPGANKGDHKWREGQWVTEGMRRWPIAEYIHDQLAGSKKFFRLLIADECHEFKAKDSAQAMAYHALRDSCSAVINLTGTIFNGKSTSLFWTLYRNDREVRRLYNFNSETAWAEYYGRLERSMKEAEEDESTTHSLKGKHENKAKEIPGISPAIYSRLLPNTIFLKKDDLGWKLPPYTEKVIRIQMGKAQEEQYQWMVKTLFEHVMKGLRSRDKVEMRESTRLMSTWLQRALGRADTGFRREMVIWKAKPGDGPDTHEPYRVTDLADYGLDTDHPFVLDDDPDMPADSLRIDPEFDKHRSRTKVPMLLDRIIDRDCILPKERGLMDLVREEVSAGHKFLVYVNQTAKNDIQPRLQKLLTAVGLRTTILPKSIKPANRDAWIKKNHQSMDVMICNPEAVKTGLDLVQFNRIAYFELPVKLETLQQSAARIYRIGQTRETKVYYFIYENTMEAQFLALVREKIKAAAALYGDNVASAIVDEEEGEDLTRELINRLMAGHKMDLDGFDSIMTPVITAGSGGDERWTEHVLTVNLSDTEEPIAQLSTYIRTNWLDFFQEDGSKSAKPKTKGNQKATENQMLLFAA